MKAGRAGGDGVGERFATGSGFDTRYVSTQLKAR